MHEWMENHKEKTSVKGDDDSMTKKYNSILEKRARVSTCYLENGETRKNILAKLTS